MDDFAAIPPPFIPVEELERQLQAARARSLTIALHREYRELLTANGRTIVHTIETKPALPGEATTFVVVYRRRLGKLGAKAWQTPDELRAIIRDERMFARLTNEVDGEARDGGADLDSGSLG